jgi:hypothetical protein
LFYGTIPPWRQNASEVLGKDVELGFEDFGGEGAAGVGETGGDVVGGERVGGLGKDSGDVFDSPGKGFGPGENHGAGGEMGMRGGAVFHISSISTRIRP